MLKSLWRDFSELVGSSWNGYGCFDNDGLVDELIHKAIAFAIVLTLSSALFTAVAIVVMMIMYPVVLLSACGIFVIAFIILLLALRTDMKRYMKGE